MLNQLHSFMETLNEVREPPFELQNLPGFPYGEYTSRMSVYSEADEWYSGDILDLIRVESGKEIEVYPVHINPIKSAVQKHTFALFGEVGEDDRPLVSSRLSFTDKAQQELASEAENVLDHIWYESNGRALQWQNGALSQVYGGCIFKLTYDPFDPLLTYKIRIEAPHPKYFVGRPAADDMFRLREAWFVRPIAQEEAVENGYTKGFDSENDVPWLIEHWTDKIYQAWVNDVPLTRYGFEVSGVNRLGFVPAVYIPHIRVNGFYGENLFDHAKGIIKELNLRVADFGDAISTDAHTYMGMVNVNGAPDVVTIAPNLNAVDLGNTIGFSGAESKPDLWDLRKDRASTTMQTLVETLYDQWRRDAFIPKVADGEDEGSQRSGLTLAMRMLSLLWHTQCERVFWTSGLNLLTRMMLRMLVEYAPKESNITIKHAALRSRQDWAPVLPRDREMLINEVVARIGADISSPETLFAILGDIQDSDAEIKAIVDFKKKLAEAMAVQQPFQAAGQKAPANVKKGMTTASSAEKSEDNPRSSSSKGEE